MNAVDHISSHVGRVQMTRRHGAHLQEWIHKTRDDLKQQTALQNRMTFKEVTVILNCAKLQCLKWL